MKNIVKMKDYLSIGELSQLSGIGIHTLRIWEKRYGAPCSKRLPSGHRRFLKEEVPRLRAIAKALESGYRASKVVTRTLEELQNLIGVYNIFCSDAEELESRSDFASKGLIIEKWVQAIHQFNEDSLNYSFYEIWNKEGPVNFIIDYLGPFLERIGNGWSAGELTVSQEHFGTEIISNFLSSKWRQLNILKDKPIAILTTFPEENHVLGLLMCAVITSLAKFKVIFLGPNSPLEDIIKTTENCQAQLLCLSISKYLNPKKVKDGLKYIRKTINKNTYMIIGGKGAIDSTPGITRPNNFFDYYEWVTKLYKEI